MPFEYFKDGRAPRWHTHPLKRNRQPPGEPLPMVTREEWMAHRTYVREDDDVRVFKGPVGTVRKTYTDTWECENPAECKRLVYELQAMHLTKYSFDIMWNFMVAPDGSIYEGRGWKYDAERPEKYRPLNGDCVDIAYIGNYIAKPVPDVMKEAMDRLVDWGVANGKIHCCHDVIPHTDPLFPLPKHYDEEHKFWDPNQPMPKEITSIEELLKEMN
ncbi:peptidoglycan-recognition protein SB2-like isoform X2 [Macrosteles quadrilineatus]|nr:peptidoglycan-recognition protein SB2-like isoform X2 [Macrosteles quadrilineatus]